MSDTAQTVQWSVGESGGPSGNLWWPSGREQPEEMLWGSIRRLALEDQLRAEFEVTQPLFYGLWIRSPLSGSQCSLLRAVFADAVSSAPRLGKYFQEFIAALDLAAEQRTAFHVSLAPPGHVDLGWITIFAHCPRCKAEAPLERWQNSYPEAPIDCPVCGHVYSPAATYSQQEDLFAERVVCDRCGREYAVRQLPQADIARLAAAHRYREACDELRWMDRIAEFYRKYPELEDAIRPAFLDLLESTDPRIQDELAEGVPFDEIAPPVPAPALRDKLPQMSASELEVVDYLQHNYFSLAHRRPAVEQEVRDYSASQLSQRVACSCGGTLQ
jgi:hypothetical protein